MQKTKHKQKIYLEDLPRYADGEFKGCINWSGLNNNDVRFEYDDLFGTFKIIKFDKDTQKILVSYNGYESWCYRSTIRRSQLTNIIGKRNIHYKYEIGDIYNNSDAELTIIDRKRLGNKKMYKYRCNKCGYDLSKPIYLKGEEIDLWIAETNLTIGVGCLGCGRANNKYVQIGVNSIVDTDPWMIPYFIGGYDEAKYYSSGSTTKVKTICPQCHNIKHKEIEIHSIKSKYSCPYCSDGISYPQKFVASVLRQCHEPFITEYHPTWAEGRKYDFYLSIENFIIEVDGGLGHGKRTYDNKPDMIGKKIDCIKDNLAIENEYLAVLRIPADESNLEYMKKSVESVLKGILDLELFVNWEVVEKDCMTSLVVKTCELYNDGMTVSEIAHLEHLSSKTVYGYIRRGRKIGIIENES